MWLSLNYSLSLFQKQPKNLLIHYWIILWKNTFQLQTKISEKAWQNLVKSRIFFGFSATDGSHFPIKYPMKQFSNETVLWFWKDLSHCFNVTYRCWKLPHMRFSCSHWKYSWFYIASVYWSLEEHCWGKRFPNQGQKVVNIEIPPLISENGAFLLRTWIMKIYGDAILLGDKCYFNKVV